MNKRTKRALTVVGVVAGGVGLVYAIRQINFARNISVREVSLDLGDTLFDATLDVITGNAQDILNSPFAFDVVLENNSNFEIEVKEVNFDVRFENQLVATFTSPFSQIIPANTEALLQLDFNFVDNIDTADIVGFAINHLADGIDITIDGKVKSTASVFETINTNYYITFNSKNQEIF
jgi:hypothetical protein